MPFALADGVKEFVKPRWGYVIVLRPQRPHEFVEGAFRALRQRRQLIGATHPTPKKKAGRDGPAESIREALTSGRREDQRSSKLQESFLKERTHRSLTWNT